LLAQLAPALCLYSTSARKAAFIWMSIVKKLLLLLLLTGIAAPVLAGPCVSLEYQEMKEMPVNELVKEACKVRQSIVRNLDDGIANIGARSGAQPNPSANDNFDQCIGQFSRIQRVLKSKGVTGEVPDLCAQQAAGETIKSPAASK
jgi:hypothetical protein